MTGLVAFGLGLALLCVLFLAARTFDAVRQVSTQLAVLTLRMTDLIEIVDALDTKLRMALAEDARPAPGPGRGGS